MLIISARLALFYSFIQFAIYPYIDFARPVPIYKITLFLSRLFLEYSWCIDIKQRAGCLSYIDDPQGFLTILAQTLTLDKANIWSTTADNIELFTNDDKIRNFVKQYLVKDVTTNVCADCLVESRKKKGLKEVVLNKQCMCRKYTKEEREHLQTLAMVTYECVVKDILCALPIWTTFLKVRFLLNGI